MANSAGGSTSDDEEAGGQTTSPATVLGRYRILDEIASGGMATVHLAYAEDDRTKFVAIKRMHAHYARDPDFASMFLDEAMVCKRIRHENVVATIDVVKERDDLLLVLELVHGESLSKLVKTLAAKRSRIPKPIASTIVIDMLRGLHAAHEAVSESGEPLLIVHRDVSPHNIVVGTDGLSRVLDFGVAKARGRVQQTQKGQLKGKLAYMSPEQARGKPVDRRSDVYAAGIVLWELLTGQRLFDHDNEAALLVALISEKPVPPSQKDPSLASLDSLVLKALSSEPDERYATAIEMAGAVEAAIPPASREEVASWVKSEARIMLLRRDAMIARARAKAAVAAKPGPEPTGGGEANDLDWDIPTTTAEDLSPALAIGKQALVRPSADETNSAPRPLVPPTPPPRRPAPAPPPRVAAPPSAAAAPSRVADEPSEPEATLPLYTPPSEFLERMRAGGDPIDPPTTPAAHKTSPPPASAGVGALPFARTVAIPEPVDDEPRTIARADAPRSFGGESFPGVSARGGAGLLAPSPISPRGVPAAALETMRLSEPPEARAEAMKSGVTSVTLTTTDMPPPIPKDQVRRLTLIGSISAATAALAMTALLVIATKKPWQASATTASRGVGLVQVEATRALEVVRRDAPAPAPPTTSVAAPALDPAASQSAAASAPAPAPTYQPPPTWSPPKTQAPPGPAPGSSSKPSPRR